MKARNQVPNSVIVKVQTGIQKGGGPVVRRVR